MAATAGFWWLASSLIGGGGKLGAISSEHLELNGEAAIHASLFHASQRVHAEVVVGVDAAIETANAQAAVIVRRSDKSTGFVGVRAESAMDARPKLYIVMVVAHGASCCCGC